VELREKLASSRRKHALQIQRYIAAARQHHEMLTRLTA
jgi:hypothetical protein